MHKLLSKLSEMNTSINGIIETLEQEKKILDAYLYKSRIRCGRSNCQCMKSDYRHESICLSYREGERSRTKSVSGQSLQRLQSMTTAYKNLRQRKKEAQKQVESLFKSLDQEIVKSTKRGRKSMEVILKNQRDAK